jgi:AcrR family transcriptional regulator
MDYPPVVGPVPAVAVRSADPVPQSAARTRIIQTALHLFAEHGVSGTSLQMIADAIGVTKAAVYHQFRTKDEIVLGVAESELSKLKAALDAAEAEESRPKAQEVLLTQVIDLAVTHRRLVSVLQNDPVMVRFLADHASFQDLTERMYAILVGDATGAEARVPAAMLSAAIGGAVMHPLVVDLDDETLRFHLLHFTRVLLHIPG